MNGKNKIEETAENMLQSLDDPKNQEKVKQVQSEDPFYHLKLNLLNFFQDRIRRIISQETLKGQIEEKLSEKVEMDELDFNNLLTLYNSVSKQNNASSESLLSLFRPTPGAPSILAENLGTPEKSKDDWEEIYDSLTPDQLQKIDKIRRLLEQTDSE